MDLIGIGECMVELHDPGGGELHLSYGGDVLNTLVYAQRSGVQSAFATLTGSDHYGYWLRSNWQQEGLDCDLVAHSAGTSPALYIIRNEEDGERHFHYWRDGSPFCDLLKNERYVETLGATLQVSAWAYFSGITLAMLDDPQRDCLLALLKRAREKGTRVGFDPNYRARLWEEADQAADWFRRACRCATLVMPSMQDIHTLTDRALTAEEVAQALFVRGAEEVVVKDGVNGSTVFWDNEMVHTPVQPVARVVDATAAGDAYNGAFLASRIRGGNPAEAARAGTMMAATVIQHAGAIMPGAAG